MSRCWNLLDCSNLLAIHLPAGRWLVQAKLTLLAIFPNNGTACGLVQSDTTIIDEVSYIGQALRTSVTSPSRPASRSR